MPGYANRAAWFGSFFSCFVPFKYCTVGTPEGKEVEVEARVRNWIKEDVEREYKQKDALMRKASCMTLEQLSTVESDVSTQESSIMSSARQ